MTTQHSAKSDDCLSVTKARTDTQSAKWTPGTKSRQPS